MDKEFKAIIVKLVNPYFIEGNNIYNYLYIHISFILEISESNFRWRINLTTQLQVFEEKSTFDQTSTSRKSAD